MFVQAAPTHLSPLCSSQRLQVLAIVLRPAQLLAQVHQVPQALHVGGVGLVDLLVPVWACTCSKFFRGYKITAPPSCLCLLTSAGRPGLLVHECVVKLMECHCYIQEPHVFDFMVQTCVATAKGLTHGILVMTEDGAHGQPTCFSGSLTCAEPVLTRPLAGSSWPP